MGTKQELAKTHGKKELKPPTQNATKQYLDTTPHQNNDVQCGLKALTRGALWDPPRIARLPPSQALSI
jgi:hypothetical protein